MRCSGIKKDGTQCNRDAQENSQYCYQHVNGIWDKVTFFLANILGVKRRFLLWFIIFTLLIFFLQYCSTQKLDELNMERTMELQYNITSELDKLKLKPDIEVEISPFLFQTAFGEYLPLIITNTGDFTFNEVHIFINSCEMEDDYYEHYRLPLLPAHSERTIPLGNRDVIRGFKKGNCYPFAKEERPYPSFSFNPWNIQQGENYTSVSTGCGICFFEAKVFAEYQMDGMNETFKKNISSYLDFPVDLTVTITNK
jgi:hypothetical protein